MGGVDDRGACGRALRDHRQQRLAGLRVGARGGLVEQQDRRLRDQRGGRLAALALPAGEQSRRAAEHVRQAQLLGDAVHRPAQRSPAQPGEGPEQPQVLTHGQPGVERGLLGAHAQPGPGLAGMRERIDSGHADPPRVRAGQAGHCLDERALARAVMADQAGDLAGGDGQPETLQGNARPYRFTSPRRPGQPWGHHPASWTSHHHPVVIYTVYIYTVYPWLTGGKKSWTQRWRWPRGRPGRGVDAAVAQRVGVTAMALYPHFSSKDALLDGLVGRILADLALPDPAGPWPERLSGLAHAVRELARRHPAVVPLLFSRPAVLPTRSG